MSDGIGKESGAIKDASWNSGFLNPPRRNSRKCRFPPGAPFGPLLGGTKVNYNLKATIVDTFAIVISTLKLFHSGFLIPIHVGE
jgi:hypothetical protein